MSKEEKIIYEILSASSQGPFFPDWEFETLFGLSRNDIKRILADWPKIIDQGKTKLAINSSFNNLLGYPIDQESVWSRYISISREELEKVYLNWRQKNTK